MKRFLRSRQTGFYFAVLKQGEDSIELLERDDNNVAVAALVDLYRGDAPNQDFLRRVNELRSLSNSSREYLRKRRLNPDDR